LLCNLKRQNPMLISARRNTTKVCLKRSFGTVENQVSDECERENDRK
jgi:hypothetical protein